MEELTTAEVAAIFKAAGDSVTEIGKAQKEGETTNEYKDRMRRNVNHLITIKGYKKGDNSTSIWTTESFTAIDAAITSGESKY